MKTHLIFPALVLALLAASCGKGKTSHPDGDEQERTVKAEDLPSAITDQVALQYPGAEIKDADEITHKDGSITYDVEISVDGSITELMYEADGDFLGVEKDDDDTDDAPDDDDNDDGNPDN